MHQVKIDLHLNSGQVLTLSYNLGDSFRLGHVQDEIEVAKTFSGVVYLSVYILGVPNVERFVIHEWDRNVKS